MSGRRFSCGVNENGCGDPEIDHDVGEEQAVDEDGVDEKGGGASEDAEGQGFC